jgi:magnesium chelatase family protein
MNARRRQQERFAGTDLVANAHMSSKHIDQYIILDDAAKDFIKKAATSLNLSPRVIHRSLKLARTIADMEDNAHVETKHIAEALQYRNKNMFIE